MYNRTYAKDKVGGKKLTVTLSRVSDESFDAGLISSSAAKFDAVLDGGIVINVQDPFMVHVLEPKSGATVHNRLNELKANMTNYESAVLGTTVPPETLNGYTVLVLGNSYDVTLEGLALWMLRTDVELTHVVITDGKITAELDRADIK
jgi:hypothetical protein